VHLRQALAQVLQIKALTDVIKSVVADAFTPMDQMLPAPTLGLLGNIQVTARTDDHSQDQAQKQAARRNRRIRAAGADRARNTAQAKNFGDIAQELSQFVHQDAAIS